MSISPRSVMVVERIRTRAEKASADAGDPVGFGFLEIVMLGLEMFTKFAPLMEFCKTPVPPTPPVPEPLAAVGVTQETWHQACVSKFAAQESSDGNGGFTKSALRRTTAEIRKSKRIKRKQAAPMALAALQTAFEESAEDIAIAAQSVKSNASNFGA